MLLECRLYLDSDIPSMHLRDEFVAPLVQTGQYVLGSKGPSVPCLKIVGHKHSTNPVYHLKILCTVPCQKQLHGMQCSRGSSYF